MSLPPPLVEYLENARRTIERARWVDAERFAKNAQAFIGEVQWRVMPTPAADAAFAGVSARIKEFAEEIGNRGRPRSQTVVENARALALVALEQFEETLVEARASDLARALGEGW